MAGCLTDITVPTELAERADHIFGMSRAPATLEDLLVGWWPRGCPTLPEDLVRSEPTPHQVMSADGVRFACCALDAIILAILEQREMELHTIEPETGRVIGISLHRMEHLVGRDGAQGPVLALGFSSAGLIDLKCSCCPYLNLFESPESYERWRAKNEEAVTMSLAIGQAWRLARRWAQAMVAN